VKFADALRQKTPPRRVGDVRLRSEPELLVGEAMAPLGGASWLPQLCYVGALASGLFCLGLLVVDPAAPWYAAAALASAAAFLTVAAMRLEALSRRRRVFVLNFSTRTLRIDRPAGIAGAPATSLAAFADVREAGVTRGPRGRYRIEVEIAREGAEPQVEVLVDGAHQAELGDLHRVSEVLRAAFGLTAPEGPSPAPR